MKFPSVARVLAACPLCSLLFAACDKPAPASEPPPATRAAASATPTPEQDFKDLASEKLRHKADKTIKSLTGFLHNEDPHLQTKLQKLVDKVAHDKDGWRKKLQQKRDELKPQIDQLKEQVATAEGKSKEDVDRQLAALEAQSHSAEKKLSELEGASGDAWKKIKAELKDAESKGDVSKEDADKEDADMPPKPSPTP